MAANETVDWRLYRSLRGSEHHGAFEIRVENLREAEICKSGGLANWVARSRREKHILGLHVTVENSA